MKKLTFLIAFVFVGLITQGQSNFKKGIYIGSKGAGSNIVLLDSATYSGGILKFYNGSSSLTVSGSMAYPGAGIALSTGSSWGTSITNNSAHWNTAYTDRLKWDGGATGLNAATGRTSLGLGNVTNESKVTMFTNPIFTGTNVRFGSPVTDTLATRAYARLYGGSGGGSGVWGLITGTLSNQTDLQNALDLKANLASPTFTGLSTNENIKIGNSTNSVRIDSITSNGADYKFYNHTGDTLGPYIPYADRLDASTYFQLSHPDTLSISSDYTLTVNDDGKRIYAGSASGITITLPPASGAAFTKEATIYIQQTGAGAIVFSPGAGVTIYSEKDSIALNTRWRWAAVIYRDHNDYVLMGTGD